MLPSKRSEGKRGSPPVAAEVVARLRSTRTTGWPLFVAAGRALRQNGIDVGLVALADLTFGRDVINAWLHSDALHRARHDHSRPHFAGQGRCA